MPHPPYSPDFSLSNIFLFLWMKKFLKGRRFADVEEVEQKMAETLNSIRIEEFKNSFAQWNKSR